MLLGFHFPGVFAVVTAVVKPSDVKKGESIADIIREDQFTQFNSYCGCDLQIIGTSQFDKSKVQIKIKDFVQKADESQIVISLNITNN